MSINTWSVSSGRENGWVSWSVHWKQIKNVGFLLTVCWALVLVRSQTRCLGTCHSAEPHKEHAKGPALTAVPGRPCRGRDSLASAHKGNESELCHLPAVQPWATYLTFLRLTLLLCKIGLPPPTFLGFLRGLNGPCKMLSQCLAQNRGKTERTLLLL